MMGKKMKPIHSHNFRAHFFSVTLFLDSLGLIENVENSILR